MSRPPVHAELHRDHEIEPTAAGIIIAAVTATSRPDPQLPGLEHEPVGYTLLAIGIDAHRLANYANEQRVVLLGEPDGQDTTVHAWCCPNTPDPDTAPVWVAVTPAPARTSALVDQ